MRNTLSLEPFQVEQQIIEEKEEGDESPERES
jgi:hypothetical protein